MSDKRIIAEIERRIEAHTKLSSEAADTSLLLTYRTRAAELEVLLDWIVALPSDDLATELAVTLEDIRKLQHYDELLNQYIVERDLARKTEAELSDVKAEIERLREALKKISMYRSNDPYFNTVIAIAGDIVEPMEVVLNAALDAKIGEEALAGSKDDD